MSNVNVLQPKDPGEIKIVRFQFGGDVGESSISTVDVQAFVVEGEDPSPSSFLSGVPAISGTDVLQRVTGGLDGCDYNLRCFATDSAGLKHLISCVIPVCTL